MSIAIACDGCDAVSRFEDGLDVALPEGWGFWVHGTGDRGPVLRDEAIHWCPKCFAEALGFGRVG